MTDEQTESLELKITSELAYSFSPGARVRTSDTDLRTALTLPDGTKAIALVGQQRPLAELTVYAQSNASPTGWICWQPLANTSDATWNVLELDSMCTTHESHLVYHIRTHPDGASHPISKRVSIVLPMPAVQDDDEGNPSTPTFITMEAVPEPAYLGKGRAAESSDWSSVAYVMRSAEALLVFTTADTHGWLRHEYPYAQLPGFADIDDQQWAWDIAVLSDHQVAIVGVHANAADQGLMIWLIDQSGSQPRITVSPQCAVESTTSVILNLGASARALEVIHTTTSSEGASSRLERYDLQSCAWLGGFELFKGLIYAAEVDRGDTNSGYLLFGTHNQSPTPDLYVADAAPTDRAPVLALGISPEGAVLEKGAAFSLNGKNTDYWLKFHSRRAEQWTTYEVTDPTPHQHGVYSEDPYYELTCKVFNEGAPVPSATITLDIVGNGDMLLHLPDHSAWMTSDQQITLVCDACGALRFRYRAQSIDTVQWVLQAAVATGSHLLQSSPHRHRPDARYVDYLSGRIDDPNPLNAHALQRMTGDGLALGDVRDPYSGEKLFVGTADVLREVETTIRLLAQATADPDLEVSLTLDCPSEGPFVLRVFESDDDYANWIRRRQPKSVVQFVDGFLALFKGVSRSYSLQRIAFKTSGSSVEVTLDMTQLGEDLGTYSMRVVRDALPTFILGISNRLRSIDELAGSSVKWLSAVFDWDQIRRTQKGLIGLIQEGFDAQQEMLRSLKPEFRNLLRTYTTGYGDKRVSDRTVLQMTPTGEPIAVKEQPQRAEYGLARFPTGTIERTDVFESPVIMERMISIQRIAGAGVEAKAGALQAAYQDCDSESDVNATKVDALFRPALDSVSDLSEVLEQCADSLFDIGEQGLEWAREIAFKDWLDEAPSTFVGLWRAVFGDTRMSAVDAITLMGAFAVNTAWKVNHGRDAEPFPVSSHLAVVDYGVMQGVFRTTVLNLASSSAVYFDHSTDLVKTSTLKALSAAELTSFALDWMFGFKLAWDNGAGAKDYIILAFGCVAKTIAMVCRAYKRISARHAPSIVLTAIALINMGLLVWIFVESPPYTTPNIVLLISELLVQLPDSLSVVGIAPPPYWQVISTLVTLGSLLVAGLSTTAGHNLKPTPNLKPVFTFDDATAYVNQGSTASIHHYEYTIHSLGSYTVQALDGSDETFRTIGTSVKGKREFVTSVGSHLRALPASLKLVIGSLQEVRTRSYREEMWKPPPPPPPPPPKIPLHSHPSQGSALLALDRRYGRRQRFGGG